MYDSGAPLLLKNCKRNWYFHFTISFFQDYSFNGVGGSGADISFIEVEEERAGEVEGSILVLDSGDEWKWTCEANL